MAVYSTSSSRPVELTVRPTISSREMLKYFATDKSTSISGVPPRSHLETACIDTPTSFPRSAWVRLLRVRSSRILSPIWLCSIYSPSFVLFFVAAAANSTLCINQLLYLNYNASLKNAAQIAVVSTKKIVRRIPPIVYPRCIAESCQIWFNDFVDLQWTYGRFAPYAERGPVPRRGPLERKGVNAVS